MGPRPPSPPRLYLPPDHPLRLQQHRHDEGRRPLVTNPDKLESVAASRPQDAPAVDGLGGPFCTPSSSMSPPREIPRSSPVRYPQPPSYTNPSQRGFEETVFDQLGGFVDSPEDRVGHTQEARNSYVETLASPTTVPPPTPSTVSVENPPIWHSRGTKGSRRYAVDGVHLKSGLKGLDADFMRESGADEDYTPDLEALIKKSQEEGGGSPYSDLFERRMATLLEMDSRNSSGAGTLLSDQSSILVPRQTLPLSSVAKQKQAQNRPVDPLLVDISRMPPTRPTSRPRSHSGEEPLHCDELGVSPHKPLSRMEKAILRRIEFGPNVDFSKTQLS
jgi:hypothetical protein